MLLLLSLLLAVSQRRSIDRTLKYHHCSSVGQTCVAPDYVLVQREVEKEFLNKIAKVIHEFYGDKENMKKTQDLSRIINARHHDVGLNCVVMLWCCGVCIKQVLHFSSF